MNEPSPDYEPVCQSLHQRECRDSRLVLQAVGISSSLRSRDGLWSLVVRREDVEEATAELEAYRQENPVVVTTQKAVPVYRGAVIAVLSYVVVTLLIAFAAEQSAFGKPWFGLGRMQAGQVVGGEWWRAVTALTLHVDGGHIAANLVFGAVFGFLAGCALGGGVAWLAIVVAGAIGNYVNAWVQSPDHSSIGASTAVFAALGILVSHGLRHRRSGQSTRLRRWSPMIGGVLLFGFVGVGGERTDVVAHLTGFLAGLVIGWFGCRIPHQWLASRAVQVSAGLAAIGLIALAWALGLRTPA